MKDTKSLRQPLFDLSAPIFIETLLIILLGTVDIVILSRHSDETVAAVDQRKMGRQKFCPHTNAICKEALL